MVTVVGMPPLRIHVVHGADVDLGGFALAEGGSELLVVLEGQVTQLTQSLTQGDGR